MRLISVPGASLACGRLRDFHFNQQGDFTHLKPKKLFYREDIGDEDLSPSDFS